MPFDRRKNLLLFTVCCSAVFAAGSSRANETQSEPVAVDRSLIKSFVQKMRDNYTRADLFLQDAGMQKKPLNLRGLSDGDNLIFVFKLPTNDTLEGEALAEVYNDTIYLSMRDILNVLDFPIEYDAQTQNFEGWFVRENKKFFLDKAAGIVRSDGQEYAIGSNILVKDDDLYFPYSSYESWFGLELKPDIGLQSVKLDAQPPLPVMERIARRNYKSRRDYSRKPATLPRGDDDYELIGVPLVDVYTRSSYRNPEGGDIQRRQDVNVRTSGEFAYGTLNTNINADNENQVTSARVSYLRESAYPELLGPLEARRFELGDVQPTRVPITGSAPPETGVRITNLDPLVRQTLPSTQVSGYILPNWDVELYRDNALLAFQETDENGYYSFDNVRLFSDRNSFRVVAYGPQGEVREENVSIPYDPTREARGESIYDVSLSFQNREFYRKFESEDEDRNSPHFVGFFETPLTDSTALRFGGRYRQEDGENKAYASTGVSTSIGQTLLNADFATDEEGELASDFVVTRQFGQHNFRSDLGLKTDEYSPGGGDRNVRTLSNRYTLTGPFPLAIGVNPRYLATANYSQFANDEDSLTANLNFNTTYKRLGFNQSLLLNDFSANPEGTNVSSNSSITGSFGRNTFRGRMNYELTPERELDSLFASWRRRITPELETQLEVGRTLETDITSLSGQLNWRPDQVTITPRFRYDSEGNAEATLTTRFGVTKNPGGIEFTGDLVAGTGSINAFVYLDANGNKVFDEGDEPIEDAKVVTPQNAGGSVTDENGYAFISQMRPNIITDVFVETGTLKDPYWIPATQGVSIMPRTGTNVQVELPVHNSGEIDGTVYARSADGSTKPLRNVSLVLQNEDGVVEQTSQTASDGFYLFSLVPPGRYALSIVDTGLPTDIARPRPKFIEIGYDGTLLFGTDIFLQAGERDVPSEILADMDDYRALHPHIDFSNNNYEIALNLGAYKSRLMTSFMWYRMKTRYGEILRDTKLYVPPSQSYALPKTGEHTLRVGLKSENLDDAYNRCRALVARDFYCKVEIYPTAKKQKFAAAPPNDG